MRLIDRLVETETVGDLLVRRVPKHDVAAADQHRHVRRGDVKPIEELLHADVAIEIDIRVRMAVARQELLDAERSGAVIRPDEHGISEPLRDQLQAAEDERPHQNLAELGIGLHECQQVFAVQLDYCAGLADARPEKRAAARDHVDLAAELTPSVDGDDRLGGARRLDDLDRPIRHHKEWNDLFARFDQHFAAPNLAHVSVRADASDLLRLQGRKNAVGG